MNYITENSQKWSQIITEELGVKSAEKLSWMSQYAQNHEIYEGLQAGAVDGGIAPGEKAARSESADPRPSRRLRCDPVV